MLRSGIPSATSLSISGMAEGAGLGREGEREGGDLCAAREGKLRVS